MLHILLLLLKIIGITLLSLIGLLVLVILLVLFVPVRYALRVKADETVLVKAHVSWLLHFLHAAAVYDGKFGVVVRLFGIPVKRIPAPQENGKKKKRSSKKRGKKDAEAARNAAQEQAVPDAERDAADGFTDGGTAHTGDKQQDAGRSADKQQDAGSFTDIEGGSAGAVPERMRNHGARIVEESQSEESKAEEAGSEGPETEKLSFFQKLARFFGAVRAFFSKILYTIHHICDKIKTIRDTIAYYLEVLRSDEGRRTLALVKRELWNLLRHIAPTTLTGSLVIGMDDPAATGQIIAIVSMFYPIYGDNVSITPDFDEKCLRGSLYLKGRIRAITLIRIAWRVYFNKDMKKFLHMLKREEKEA